MTETTIQNKLVASVSHIKGSLKPIYAYMIWLPPLAIIAATIAAWHFVRFAFAANPAINGLILVIMSWGAISMAQHIRSCYKEDKVFFAGIDWLRKGAYSSEPNPKLGPAAYVQGMLERLEKIGLGHQVYVHSAAMEPEIVALEQYFEKKQELSNFLVGLMVGLGLLGTFIGLLETLISTSELIGGIAASLNGGGDMEAEFAKIVGGLQKPLSSMGTAFSASMFGLVGSIMLGFQVVVVNKAVAMLVENIREEVLSLAEKSKVNANVEITERYLAVLLADIMEQHRQTEARLLEVSEQMAALTPSVTQAALSSAKLADAVSAQYNTLERTIMAVGQVRDVVPLIAELASATSQNLRESAATRLYVDEIAKHLPDQAMMSADLRIALKSMVDLRLQLEESRNTSSELAVEVRLQGDVLKRVDAVLWSGEKKALREALDADQKN